LSFWTRTPDEIAPPRRELVPDVSIPALVPEVLPEPVPPCAMLLEPAPTQSTAAMPSVHVLVLLSFICPS
jgi:hypothetical protein